jgi:hypothetical protein
MLFRLVNLRARPGRLHDAQDGEIHVNRVTRHDLSCTVVPPSNWAAGHARQDHGLSRYRSKKSRTVGCELTGECSGSCANAWRICAFACARALGRAAARRRHTWITFTKAPPFYARKSLVRTDA